MSTRVIILQYDDHKDKIIYRLEKGWTLRFILSPSLMGRRVSLMTNHPATTGNNSRLDLNTYREVPWIVGSEFREDDLSSFADVSCSLAGPFRYFFYCDQAKRNCAESADGSGYFHVAPTLTIGSDEQFLPLDCIQSQTVLSKLLGPLNEWEGRLIVSAKSGYNMVHITPCQTLGLSNSSYCIGDHLTLNPCFNSANQKYTFDDLKLLLNKLRVEQKLLFVSDVVWNHMAADSAVLKKHPECAYNLQNSTHLRPAYVLDRALQKFGNEVAVGKWAKNGLPAAIGTGEHLNALRKVLIENVLPSLRLHEFFQCDVDALTEKFKEEIEALGGPCKDQIPDMPLLMLHDPEYRRLKASINMPLALLIFNRAGSEIEVERQTHCIELFRLELYRLNHECENKCWSDLDCAVNAIIGTVDYERVAGHGLKVVDFSETHPLCPRYFVHADPALEKVDFNENIMYSDKAPLIMACNGWVMSDDPLANFAELPSMVYFRRQLIAWGDNVKLRYGDEPKDCPFLWDYMQKYTELSVDLFDGLRIDNCHSTPINVAEYLLDKARRRKPELYVVAELFTGSEDIDNIFVNRLGLTSLVREAQSAGDSHEEGRLVYKYGGDPVGAFVQHAVRPMAPSIAHAIFMDLTHDNQSPVQTRTVLDLFPSAAIVNMACCASGSSRGYDELVPYHIHVVNEKRLYSSWTEDRVAGSGFVNSRSGIIEGKRVLNALHYELGSHGYCEVFVDQVTPHVVAVTRHNPESHQSVVLIARTAFNQAATKTNFVYVPPLKISGIIDEVIFEASLIGKPKSSPGSGTTTPTKKQSKFIEGLDGYEIRINQHLKLLQSQVAEFSVVSDTLSEVEFVNFPPGSVIALRTSLHSTKKLAARQLRVALSSFGYRIRSLSGSILSKDETNDLQGIASRLTLADLNRVLFRCAQEEANEHQGAGVYTPPRWHPFVYCGLHSFINELNPIRLKNDLGHPICDNLRQGDWMIDYMVNRLMWHQGTKPLGIWLKSVFEHYKQLPHALKPSYFDAVLGGAYDILIDSSIAKMSPFVQKSSKFVQNLAMTSVILCGHIQFAVLSPLSDNISNPKPDLIIVDQLTAKKEQACVTIAAGLPHFSHGIFRTWGRDTFIALPGLLLLTARYDEARHVILGFAGALRHGLIPNLLGAGHSARYNCRDAVWLWLRSIKLYCQHVPNGLMILNEPVLRLYPTDDSMAGEDDTEEPLMNTVQEALQRHFEGIVYRERNAGSQIDEYMKPEGFDVSVGIDKETGFVFGGNRWNCGTWMDKMGSCEKAGNRGVPASPRDGSAVELVGLLYSVLRWIDDLCSNGAYKFNGVKSTDEAGKILNWTWQEWSDKIKANFETFFWIPIDKDEKLDASNEVDLINHRGIYKDLVGSSQSWTDYQLRPNFCITLAEAPELVSPKNASVALENAEKYLLGPLGMKTLDNNDWNYVGVYNNNDDSDNYKCARGFNYHQGPEWVWPVGFFLRAKLKNAKLNDAKDVCSELTAVKRILSHHLSHIENSPWQALPELTNENGMFCPPSCPAQAWSSSCLLELMYEMRQLASK